MKRELNTWATVHRILGTILSIGSLVAGPAIASLAKNKLWILYGAISCVFLFISLFTLAAFLDTTAENANRLANIERNMQQQPKQEQKKTYTTISAAPRQSSPGFIVCPRCRESQSADRTVCFNCGTLFKKD